MVVTDIKHVVRISDIRSVCVQIQVDKTEANNTTMITTLTRISVICRGVVVKQTYSQQIVDVSER